MFSLKQKNLELESSQDHINSLEKANEDLMKSISSLTMDQGLSIEKFEALKKAHETLQSRFDSSELVFNKKSSKLQKDLEIKANNSQEFIKKIESLKEETEKTKRRSEKIIEELEIKHSEEIKQLYDERRVHMEKLIKEKETLNEEEIEKYKKLIGNLKKQVDFIISSLIFIFFFFKRMKFSKKNLKIKRNSIRNHKLGFIRKMNV